MASCTDCELTISSLAGLFGRRDPLNRTNYIKAKVSFPEHGSRWYEFKIDEKGIAIKVDKFFSNTMHLGDKALKEFPSDHECLKELLACKDLNSELATSSLIAVKNKDFLSVYKQIRAKSPERARFLLQQMGESRLLNLLEFSTPENFAFYIQELLYSIRENLNAYPQDMQVSGSNETDCLNEITNVTQLIEKLLNDYPKMWTLVSEHSKDKGELFNQIECLALKTQALLLQNTSVSVIGEMCSSIPDRAYDILQLAAPETEFEEFEELSDGIDFDVDMDPTREAVEDDVTSLKVFSSSTPSVGTPKEKKILSLGEDLRRREILSKCSSKATASILLAYFRSEKETVEKLLFDRPDFGQVFDEMFSIAPDEDKKVLFDLFKRGCVEGAKECDVVYFEFPIYISAKILLSYLKIDHKAVENFLLTREDFQQLFYELISITTENEDNLLFGLLKKALAENTGKAKRVLNELQQDRNKTLLISMLKCSTKKELVQLFGLCNRLSTSKGIEEKTNTLRTVQNIDHKFNGSFINFIMEHIHPNDVDLLLDLLGYDKTVELGEQQDVIKGIKFLFYGLQQGTRIELLERLGCEGFFELIDIENYSDYYILLLLTSSLSATILEDERADLEQIKKLIAVYKMNPKFQDILNRMDKSKLTQLLTPLDDAHNLQCFLKLEIATQQEILSLIDQNSLIELSEYLLQEQQHYELAQLLDVIDMETCIAFFKKNNNEKELVQILKKIKSERTIKIISTLMKDEARSAESSKHKWTIAISEMDLEFLSRITFKLKIKSAARLCYYMKPEKQADLIVRLGEAEPDNAVKLWHLLREHCYDFTPILINKYFFQISKLLAAMEVKDTLELCKNEHIDHLSLLLPILEASKQNELFVSMLMDSPKENAEKFLGVIQYAKVIEVLSQLEPEPLKSCVKELLTNHYFFVEFMMKEPTSFALMAKLPEDLSPVMTYYCKVSLKVEQFQALNFEEQLKLISCGNSRLGQEWLNYLPSESRVDILRTLVQHKQAAVLKGIMSESIHYSVVKYINELEGDEYTVSCICRCSPIEKAILALKKAKIDFPKIKEEMLKRLIKTEVERASTQDSAPVSEYYHGIIDTDKLQNVVKELKLELDEAASEAMLFLLKQPLDIQKRIIGLLYTQNKSTLESIYKAANSLPAEVATQA
ncbi:hypothetical protein SOPP22_07370 [Shewanella sp. OPT22]|nr:hypothetical protein SOPP22_07370 [Shewanella sp. OPT22]